jgi:hypothetical protein
MYAAVPLAGGVTINHRLVYKKGSYINLRLLYGIVHSSFLFVWGALVSYP